MPADDVDPTPPPKPTDPASTPGPEPAATSWPQWLYTGPDRIYTNIPVTVTTGSIVTWHTDPGLGDGAWTTTTQAANKLPDNHREDPASPAAAELPEEG